MHDAQFGAVEAALADAYGHACVDDAVAFAARCGAGRLLLTHHAPDRSDVAVDELVAAARGGDGPPVEVAVQGTVVAVRPAGASESAPATASCYHPSGWSWPENAQVGPPLPLPGRA